MRSADEVLDADVESDEDDQEIHGLVERPVEKGA